MQQQCVCLGDVRGATNVRLLWLWYLELNCDLWPLLFLNVRVDGDSKTHSLQHQRGVGALLCAVRARPFRMVIRNLAGGFSSRTKRTLKHTWTHITLPEGCYVKIIPRSLFFTAWDDIKMLSLSWKDRLQLTDVSRCVSQLNRARNQKRRTEKCRNGTELCTINPRAALRDKVA